MTDAVSETDIAIIGVAGRFPGANDIDAFWRNLIERKETARRFNRDELIAAGAPVEQVDHPNYVPANHVLEDADRFDADYFSVPAHEAALIDPQQRVLLETAHVALEHAGYGDTTEPRPVGVFAGVGMNTYVLENLGRAYREGSSVDHYQVMVSNDKDFLATRISYKLNLSGPSVTVGTACSTSLTAVHMACQSLLGGECDMALAGAASVRFPQTAGYLYQEGMIFSPDGRCKAFDQDAQGTILGDGAGVVVLKRLADALADGDTVHAVVKGSAMNNDGARKMTYTAPSAEGEEEAIVEAQGVAGVDPRSVTYVEAHGTGTYLGDPIEIAALTSAFRQTTEDTQFCAIGSVKTNIGHLDVAAGMAGLIKTVLMLRERTLVPSLHFTTPNPEIDFTNSPFFVQTEASPWESDGPLRAGVSAFGIGGTNAHVVLEQAPENEAAPSSGPEVLVISAATQTALEKATANLARHLRRNKTAPLADAAHTLSCGRNAHVHRRYVLAETTGEAALALAISDPRRGAAALASEPSLGVWIGEGFEGVWDLAPLAVRAPIFAEALAEAAAAAGLGDLTAAPLDPAALGEASRRAAFFCVGYGLGALWKRWSALEWIAGAGAGAAAAACLRGDCDVNEGARRAREDAASPAPPPAAGVVVALFDDVAEAVQPPEAAQDLLSRQLGTLGAVWAHGAAVDWSAVHGGRGLGRIPLPTYPFERKRHLIEPDQHAAPSQDVSLRADLEAAAPAERAALIARHLQGKLSAILGQDAPSPGPDVNLLEDQNLDSLILVEIVADLGMKLGASLSASALIEHPTIAAFAAHALVEAGYAAPAAKTQEEEPDADMRRSRRAALAGRRDRREVI